MDTARKEEIKKFLKGFSNPTALMDNEFRCVYSNKPKLIPKESSMMLIFQKAIVLPIKKTHITMAMINACFYSVRIAPFEDGLYICEFFDHNAILLLAENTNIYDKILPIIDGVEYNTAALWRCYNTLHNKLESEGGNEYLGCASDMEKYLISLDSVTQNIAEYINMLFYTSETTFTVNLLTTMVSLIERCNTILAVSGRYVDIVHGSEDIYINAQARHVVSAIVNAIQNALMYSPRDCIPYVSLNKVKENNRDYALIQIMNKSIMYIDQGSGEDSEYNFDHQRIGYGIPIIKRFAEMTGGSFSLVEENGIMRTKIKLALVESPYNQNGKGTVNTSQYVYYKTGIPDIVDLKMFEVNNLFRK